LLSKVLYTVVFTFGFENYNECAVNLSVDVLIWDDSKHAENFVWKILSVLKNTNMATACLLNNTLSVCERGLYLCATFWSQDTVPRVFKQVRRHFKRTTEI